MSFQQLATSAFLLTNEQISFFQDHGFLQVDFSPDEDLLDSIVEKVNPLYHPQPRQKRYSVSTSLVLDIGSLAEPEQLNCQPVI